MSAKKHHVELRPEQRADLEVAARSNKNSRRERARARILLAADGLRPGGAKSDALIARQIGVSTVTVANVRRRWSERAVGAAPARAALRQREQARRKAPKLDGVAQARLCTLACSAPPDGRKIWTMSLLAGHLIELGLVASISGEAVRLTLKKMRSSRG